MKMFARFSLIALSFIFASSAFCQQQKFMVNPDASQVNFGLNGSGHHVQGVFHVASGSLTFDTNHSIAGMITVGAGSGNSGEPSRDKKMNSEVLNSDKFPEISFAPKSYAGALAMTGDSTIQISGVFTLHGAPHDLTVPMQVHIDGSNVMAKGHFVVPYVQWGLKDPSVFVLKVAKEADIDLNLVGSIAAANQ